MINPSVFELVKCSINNQDFCIEDNIGEAIHLHIGSLRISMSTLDFAALADSISKSINALVQVNGFKVENYDSFFLYRMAKNLPYLTRISNKEINLKEILVSVENENGEVCTGLLFGSDIHKMIIARNNNVDRYAFETFIFQSAKERIEFVENKVKQKDFSIIIDESGHIIDGVLAACFLLENGVERVEATVFEFDKTKYIPPYIERIKRKW